MNELDDTVLVRTEKMFKYYDFLVKLTFIQEKNEPEYLQRVEIVNERHNEFICNISGETAKAVCYILNKMLTY